MEREEGKKIEIQERTFYIEKMNAMESVAVLKELLTRTLPIDLMSMFDSTLQSSNMLGAMGSINKSQMDIDEFVLLQSRILKYSYEILPSGSVPVITKQGTIGINDFEKNITLMVKLLFESVRVNYESFFIEGLKEIGLLGKVQEEASKLMKDMTVA